VYPDQPGPSEAREIPTGGYQMMLRGEIMRGKFRNSYEKPEAFEPGKPTQVRFTLNDLHHTFRKGHKIMVHIQCSWFPMYDRNPQTFTDIYSARESDFVKAVQKIFYSKDLPTGIVLNVMEN
jgi:predicted acyl esterase